MDPIFELVEDLWRHGRPSLAWLTRWSAGGGDPVAAAWAVSRDHGAMASRSAIARKPGHAWEAYGKAYGRHPGGGHGEVACAWCAEEIRRAVPVPPRLGELLAACAEGAP